MPCVTHRKIRYAILCSLMPRRRKPKAKPKPEPTVISAAAQALREISKDSQQFFGATLRISTRALQQYEWGQRVPGPSQNIAYILYAVSVDRKDLAQPFLTELRRQLEPPPALAAKGFRFVIVDANLIATLKDDAKTEEKN